jgi:hypothetical protein
MQLSQAIDVINKYMEKHGRAVAEKQVAIGLVACYHAKSHSAGAGQILAHVLAEGVDASPANMSFLFHSLANHSAWTKKFQALGIFPASTKTRSKSGMTAEQKANKLLAELTAEIAGENEEEEEEEGILEE